MEASKKFSLRFVSPVILVPVLAWMLTAVPQPNLSAEDPPRETAVCLDCHEDQAGTLKLTPHDVTETGGDGGTRVACTDCHSGDSRHYEEDPEAFPMANPADLRAMETGELCTTCHLNDHQQNMLEGNVHTLNDINCTACHAVHGSKDHALLPVDQATLCLDCHSGVESQFQRPFRHPVNDNIVACTECHFTMDKRTQELSLDGSNACFDCHAEMQGPFPFEHQATVDYSTEEGGCLNCHDPHGSSLPRMLKQPYEPPHYQLCSSCHSVPLHNNNSMHGTMWAGRACNDCHTDIHGSYTNRNFLSESLLGQGCFNSGCHQF